MDIGAQYYRPPFPNNRFWEDDLKRMRDSGLNAVQLWVVWAWVEPSPGEFLFDDYDRLVELAATKGLGVVLSTVAELQPLWIHRVVPGAELVCHDGRRVVSVNRKECHFGITPGGCWDHEAVWERMKMFLEKTVSRYRPADNIRGWDAWNELRWDVASQGRACYCPETVARFRSWLLERHGGLDGLNGAWQRRYRAVEDIDPGRMAGHPYTETMAFEHFLTWRAVDHAHRRYDVIKAIDPARPVTVHGGEPSPMYAGGGHSWPLNRGNDWGFAERTDGVGCSSFPYWFAMDQHDFGGRVSMIGSVRPDKEVWLSELQGGRAANGANLYPSVDAAAQQKWVWQGIGAGAKKVLFWCWRDEVFTGEAAGFGLAGSDGLAEERLAAMAVTGRVVADQGELLDSYRPDEAQVGVLFSPTTYYLHGAREGNAWVCEKAIRGYMRALLERNVPVRVFEEEHLDGLGSAKLLLAPRVTALPRKAEEKLVSFVEHGGTLVLEAEADAFDETGVYRYPEDRPLAKAFGVVEVGRRSIPDEVVHVRCGTETFQLTATQWFTPIVAGEGEVWAENGEGAIVAEQSVGKGKVVYCAFNAGHAVGGGTARDLGAFLSTVALRAGASPLVRLADREQSKALLRHGTSLGRRVIFVYAADAGAEVKLVWRRGFVSAGSLTEIVAGVRVDVSGMSCSVKTNEWGLAVLVEDDNG